MEHSLKTKEEVELGIKEHFPRVEDCVIEMLWQNYEEDPKRATRDCHGLYWIRKNDNNT